MKKLVILFFVALLVSCSSTKLIDQWHNPDTPVYEAQKILVVGMSPDKQVRRTYEEALSQQLERKGIVAVRSVDFFENVFQVDEKTEKEMDLIENLLLEAGFDSILFSKVTGSEDKVTLLQSYNSFKKEFTNFKDYYIENQHVYASPTSESYKVYHTETSIFCLCAGKERELLWKGNIDLVGPEKSKKSIDEYIKVLMKSFEENRIVLPQ
ncbi:MAG: hypothetical protein R2793_07750 [Flavobacteriaceae bacterium]